MRSWTGGVSLIKLSLCFLTLLSTVAIPTYAQGVSHRNFDMPPPVRVNDESCDAIWDGSLFGILPGVFVGAMFTLGEGCGGSARDGCQKYFLGGAALGAALGAVLDWSRCNREQGDVLSHEHTVTLVGRPNSLLVEIGQIDALLSPEDIEGNGFPLPDNSKNRSLYPSD